MDLNEFSKFLDSKKEEWIEAMKREANVSDLNSLQNAEADKISKFLDSKRKEWESTLRRKAKEIKLLDIIAESKKSELNLTPYAVMTPSEFKKGLQFRYSLCQGLYDVEINQNRLLLRFSDLDLVQYRGRGVTDFYLNLVNKALRDVGRV